MQLHVLIFILLKIDTNVDHQTSHTESRSRRRQPANLYRIRPRLPPAWNSIWWIPPFPGRLNAAKAALTMMRVVGTGRERSCRTVSLDFINIFIPTPLISKMIVLELSQPKNVRMWIVLNEKLIRVLRGFTPARNGNTMVMEVQKNIQGKKLLLELEWKKRTSNTYQILQTRSKEWGSLTSWSLPSKAFRYHLWHLWAFSDRH